MSKFQSSRMHDIGNYEYNLSTRSFSFLVAQKETHSSTLIPIPCMCRRTHEVILALGVWSTSRPRLFCIRTSPPRKSRYPCLPFCHANECNNRVSLAAVPPAGEKGRREKNRTIRTSNDEKRYFNNMYVMHSII